MDRGAWRATVHSIAKSWTQETKEQQILANDVEYFFICIFAIFISSVVKYLFHIFCPYSNWIVWSLFVFFTIEFSEFF